MDRAQTRLVVVLSLVLAAIAGLLWWQGTPTTAETDEATAAVWTVDPDALVRLAIERPEGAVAFERRGDAWWITEPEEALAERSRVEELATQLAGLTRAIPVAAVGSEAFGLGDPPRAVVTWTPRDGAPVELRVGDRAPAAYRTYVRTADGGIGAANGDPTALLHAPVARFRDERVFRFAPGDVRSVQIAFPEHTLEVRGEGRSWHLSGFGRAEADRVDDLVMDLLDLRFDEEVPGLDPGPPHVTVDVGLASGEVQTLVLGAGDGSGFPARAADGRVGRVFDGAEGMLGRGPTDVGQQTAFQLRPDVATRLVVDGGLGSFVATRDGPDWVSPPHDAGVVYDRVLALSSLLVERTLDPAGPSDPPEAHVTIEEPAPIDGGAPLVVTFAVGPIQPDGTRAVRDTAGPGPGVRVRADRLDPLLRALP